jgi:hypothetical protein
MDKPIIREEVVGVIHYAPRQDHNPSTETVHTTGNVTDSHNPNTTTGNKDDVGGISHTSCSPRTTFDIQIPLSNIRTHSNSNKNIHIIDEYFKPSHQTKIDIIDPENPPVGTSDTYHSGTDKSNKTRQLQNKRRGEPDRRPTKKQDRKRTSPNRNRDTNITTPRSQTATKPRSPRTPTDDFTTDGPSGTHHNDNVYTRAVQRGARLYSAGFNINQNLKKKIFLNKNMFKFVFMALP